MQGFITGSAVCNDWINYFLVLIHIYDYIHMCQAYQHPFKKLHYPRIFTLSFILCFCLEYFQMEKWNNIFYLNENIPSCQSSVFTRGFAYAIPDICQFVYFMSAVLCMDGWVPNIKLAYIYKYNSTWNNGCDWLETLTRPNI